MTGRPWSIPVAMLLAGTLVAIAVGTAIAQEASDDTARTVQVETLLRVDDGSFKWVAADPVVFLPGG